MIQNLYTSAIVSERVSEYYVRLETVAARLCILNTSMIQLQMLVQYAFQIVN